LQQQTTKQAETNKMRPRGIAYAQSEGEGRMRGLLKGIL